RSSIGALVGFEASQASRNALWTDRSGGGPVFGFPGEPFLGRLGRRWRRSDSRRGSPLAHWSISSALRNERLAALLCPNLRMEGSCGAFCFWSSCSRRGNRRDRRQAEIAVGFPGLLGVGLFRNEFS